MLEDNLKELETWRRDLRHQIGDLICDDAHDAPLRLLGVASTISYIEVAIRGPVAYKRPGTRGAGKINSNTAGFYKGVTGEFRSLVGTDIAI